MVLLFVPFYALSLVVSDPTSPIVQIFTFFPYTAPFTAMLRNGLGSLPRWQAAIVITELIVFGADYLLPGRAGGRWGSADHWGVRRAGCSSGSIRGAWARREACLAPCAGPLGPFWLVWGRLASAVTRSGQRLEHASASSLMRTTPAGGSGSWTSLGSGSW